MIDQEWPMIEEAVFRLFGEITAECPGEHVAIGPRLAELGWSDIEAEYPIEACALLFRAQGRSLANTDSLARVMLHELGTLLDKPADGIVLPALSDGCVPSSDEQRVAGIVLGPLQGRLVVPVSGPTGAVSVGVVDASRMDGARLDTFDPSVHWTRVHGALDATLIDAPAQWDRAIAAAHQALATELLALADAALGIAVDHAKVRVQFGAPIGSFQSPRHTLAEACAALEGARAVLSESRRGGSRLLAQTAKAAAGRAHRAVSDAALQVCGAIGLTAEHHLHRYVAKGFQIDALCGSHLQLEAQLSEQLFDYAPGLALPAISASG
jgi:Acyl-CoA dehydrogenase, C-terminal domain